MKSLADDAGVVALEDDMRVPAAVPWADPAVDSIA
jgi:hypothetical protein